VDKYFFEFVIVVRNCQLDLWGGLYFGELKIALEYFPWSSLGNANNNMFAFRSKA